MGCILFLFALIGPRFATFMWWLMQPTRFSAAFPNFLIPFLGVIFLPWTTLMYVAVFPGGLNLWEWLFVGLAFAVDIASYGGGAYRLKK